VPDDRLTRIELLRRAGAGAATVAVGGPAISWLFDDRAVAALVGRAAGGTTHRFRSRPDLRPPVVSVVEHAGTTGHGYLLLAPSSGPGQRGPLIVDDAGNVVWCLATKKVAMNLRAALHQGKPVLTWWEGDVDKQGLGMGEHVIVDSSYREIARFPVGHRRGGDLHEFVVTPNGTALVSAWAKVTRNLLGRGGRRRHRVVDGIAQELEIPSGRVLFEWRSLDHVALDETHIGVGPLPFDYFHINSIDLAPDGDLILSARNTWAVYKVSRTTGRIVWRLGGRKSDFAMGPGTKFAWQHDARAYGDGRISIFDDGAAPAVEKQSRGLLIRLDEAQKRATLEQTYVHHPHLLAHYMGSMQVLGNGNVVVGWGSDRHVTEFAQDGSVVFDARLPRGGQTYRAVRMPWVGRPGTRPSLAGGRVNGRRRLYASWNGATELASWHVRTGSRATNLRDAGTVRSKGFETVIELQDSASYAAVTALDAAGKPLATSRTIRL
jgi:hypothetical protein